LFFAEGPEGWQLLVLTPFGCWSLILATRQVPPCEWHVVHCCNCIIITLLLHIGWLHCRESAVRCGPELVGLLHLGPSIGVVLPELQAACARRKTCRKGSFLDSLTPAAESQHSRQKL
jgi:hypothetical protein